RGGERPNAGRPGGIMLGRDRELAAVERALADARLGRSAALVIRGEAVIGKTSLLRFAVEGAVEMRVLAARGVQFEADVPFSGLDELLRPTLSLLERLPATHATALRSSLGLGERVETDRLLVGAATLGLISGYAEQAPVLVVVDDAQWLDRASAEALAFATRRLLADPVAVLITVRDGEDSTLIDAGLPELRLSPLDHAAAAALLERAAADTVDPHVAGAILDTAGGNPLALVELAAEAAKLAYAAAGSPLPVATTGARPTVRSLRWRPTPTTPTAAPGTWRRPRPVAMPPRPRPWRLPASVRGSAPPTHPQPRLSRKPPASAKPARRGWYVCWRRPRTPGW